MSFFFVASSDSDEEKGLAGYPLDDGWDSEDSEDSEEDADETELNKIMRRRRKKSENKDEEGRPRHVIFSFEYPEENIDAKEAIRRRELAEGNIDVSKFKPGDVLKFLRKSRDGIIRDHTGIILYRDHKAGYILYSLASRKHFGVNTYYLSNGLYVRSIGHPLTEDNLRRFIFNETDKKTMNERQRVAFMKEVRDMEFDDDVKEFLR
jgi:hypothetical protein